MLNQIALLSTASALALALALPAQAQDTAAEEAPATEETVVPDGETTDAQATDADADAAPAEGEAAATLDATPEGDVTRDTVVASVNGTDITLGEVMIAARQLPQEYQQLPPDILFDGVVDQLVQQELLAQSVTEEPAIVDLVLGNQRRSMLANSVIEEVVSGAVTEEALQAAYDEAFAGVEPTTEWNASHILVETEEEAQAIVGRLEAGEDFAALAQELSTDPGSGANGGELGWFGPGMMVPQFEEGVAGLEAGQVSAPVQSDFGWHVIRLNETRPQAAPALEAVRGELQGQVQQAAIAAHLEVLEAAAEVTRPEPGRFDPMVLNDASLLED